MPRIETRHLPMESSVSTQRVILKIETVSGTVLERSYVIFDLSPSEVCGNFQTPATSKYEPQLREMVTPINMMAFDICIIGLDTIT